jgi:hypothetical protein
MRTLANNDGIKKENAFISSCVSWVCEYYDTGGIGWQFRYFGLFLHHFQSQGLKQIDMIVSL